MESYRCERNPFNSTSRQIVFNAAKGCVVEVKKTWLGLKKEVVEWGNCSRVRQHFYPVDACRPTINVPQTLEMAKSSVELLPYAIKAGKIITAGLMAWL